MASQPTTVNMSFDTSLVYPEHHQSDTDTAMFNVSFSSMTSTESDPSLNGRYPAPSQTAVTAAESPDLPSSITPKAPSHPTFPTASTTTSSTPVHHLPTLATYDAWAPVYDIDGNMLQAIDDLELATLLPNFLTAVTPSNGYDTSPESSLHILDLGCGTGRNTIKLATHPYSPFIRVSLFGLDFSSGMLALASQKLENLRTNNAISPSIVSTALECTDCFAAPPPAILSTLPAFDAIISTLVLEHVPLAPFFTTVASLLKEGGQALITNMHPEMGNISQAGFVAEDGTKVRGESFAHGVQETVEEAKRRGFEILGVWERGVQEKDLGSGAVGERGMKWVGVKVWYAVWIRKM